jgi:hypothetical protein
MKNLKAVKVKSTGQSVFVESSREESRGVFAYSLIDSAGNPVWNGNTRMFSFEQIDIGINDIEHDSQMMDDEQDECYQGYMEYKRGY